MSVLVDTNVLLRSVQPSHPMHDPAVRTVAALIRSGETVVITPQIVAEFWNVATRPMERNGLGWSDLWAGDDSRARAALGLTLDGDVSAELLTCGTRSRGQGPYLCPVPS